MVPSVLLNQQAALHHVGLIQRFTEIEHRGKGDILVPEPGHPFIARLGGKGFAQEGNQRGLRRFLTVSGCFIYRNRHRGSDYLCLSSYRRLGDNNSKRLIGIKSLDCLN